MSFGNDYIAGDSMELIRAHDIVIQLFVDIGIPGYGHRYNLLDPAWNMWSVNTNCLKQYIGGYKISE